MSEKDIWDYMAGLKSSIVSTMRWYLGFSFGVILLLGGLIGWTAKATVENKAEISEIKRDFGDVNSVLHKEYPDILVYENNYVKYVLRRGSKE